MCVLVNLAWSVFLKQSGCLFLQVELPALPTSFTLPIGSMPTISFGGNMTPSATSNTSTLTQPSRSGVGTNLSSPLFRFSSPILKEGGDDLGGPSLSPVSPHVRELL